MRSSQTCSMYLRELPSARRSPFPRTKITVLDVLSNLHHTTTWTLHGPKPFLPSLHSNLLEAHRWYDCDAKPSISTRSCLIHLLLLPHSLRALASSCGIFKPAFPPASSSFFFCSSLYFRLYISFVFLLLPCLCRFPTHTPYRCTPWYIGG